jgi:hypothetical protein
LSLALAIKTSGQKASFKEPTVSQGDMGDQKRAWPIEWNPQGVNVWKQPRSSSTSASQEYRSLDQIWDVYVMTSDIPTVRQGWLCKINNEEYLIIGSNVDKGPSPVSFTVLTVRAHVD